MTYRGHPSYATRPAWRLLLTDSARSPFNIADGSLLSILSPSIDLTFPPFRTFIIVQRTSRRPLIHLLSTSRSAKFRHTGQRNAKLQPSDSTTQTHTQANINHNIKMLFKVPTSPDAESAPANASDASATPANVPASSTGIYPSSSPSPPRGPSPIKYWKCCRCLCKTREGIAKCDQCQHRNCAQCKGPRAQDTSLVPGFFMVLEYFKCCRCEHMSLDIVGECGRCEHGKCEQCRGPFI